jgi:hypothetical protein
MAAEWYECTKVNIIRMIYISSSSSSSSSSNEELEQGKHTSASGLRKVEIRRNKKN